MARAKKKPATPFDMVLSMAVLLIPVLLIAWFFTRAPNEESTVPTVDWKPVLATARSEAPYPVLAPADTPDGWRPTQVSWTPKGQPDPGGNTVVRNTWKLGFIDDDGVYIAIVQGDDQIPQLIDATTRQGKADGTQQIGSLSWDRYVSDDGRTRSLVSRGAKVTTIVDGDTPDYQTLITYVASLTDS